MAQFSDLPTEIRIKIFECAIHRRPRVVEITKGRRKGTIISKTHPPALLHVNQVGRYVVRKSYKPWLPEFKGTKVYQPWAGLVEQFGKDVSALDNVPLERQNVRYMALRVPKNLNYRVIAESVGVVKNLKRLHLIATSTVYSGEDSSSGLSSGFSSDSSSEFTSDSSSDSLSDSSSEHKRDRIYHKACRIIHALLKRKEAEEKQKKNKTESLYVAPNMSYKRIYEDTYVWDHNWTTYKYPKKR